MALIYMKIFRANYKSTQELTDDVYDLSFKFNSQTLTIFESICDKSMIAILKSQALLVS